MYVHGFSHCIGIVDCGGDGSGQQHTSAVGGDVRNVESALKVARQVVARERVGC